jgi:hypothetical protein
MPEHQDDDTRELHPVATDQPGLILHRPYQKLRQIIVLYTLLPLVCAFVGGWIATQVAYQRSETHTDRRIAVLEGDLAQRRKANAEANAARDARTAELLALVCQLLDHAQPRDAGIEASRAKYRCTGNPPLAPTPGPSSAPPRQPGQSRVPPERSGGTGGGMLPTPAPRPVPEPSPSLSPSERGYILCVLGLCIG